MMKTALLSTCVLAGVLLSCNSAPSKKERDSAVTNPELTNTSASCFMKTVGKDTFLLQILVDDRKVNGVLDYNFFEKDQSSGILEGRLTDNILRASYSYTSEGTKSTRNVVFKLMGDQAYEGLADSADADGNPIFTPSDAALKFDPVPYKKQACQ
ncbi:hypothetical protein EGT74_15775 [Chitinophaga lutea]|uniref:Lipoprotein n=1 Tax=Chitinophaga lutea TaxID=2488634 RepID=A0A3N4PIJ9_9BACT|nr:hypothetical protein [Chitinophaga lutea]RPE08503.1 hypothetical protein EGT74_15775 [Chitinophaga lutea]